MRKILLVLLAAMAAMASCIGCAHPNHEGPGPAYQGSDCPVCERELSSCLSNKNCTQHQNCVNNCDDRYERCRFYTCGFQ